jgi:hypothetical protein
MHLHTNLATPVAVAVAVAVLRWDYKETFMNVPTMKRIMLTGGTVDPPLQVRTDPYAAFDSVFTYDRQLQF